MKNDNSIMKNDNSYQLVLNKKKLTIGIQTLKESGFDETDTFICQQKNERELIIRAQRDICIFCGCDTNLTSFKDTCLCKECKENLYNITPKV